MRLLIFILLILQPNFNSIKASPNEDNDIFKNLKYRNVGPTRGGRVTTVHGVDAERNTFYMVQLEEVYGRPQTQEIIGLIYLMDILNHLQ